MARIKKSQQTTKRGQPKSTSRVKVAKPKTTTARTGPKPVATRRKPVRTTKKPVKTTKPVVTVVDSQIGKPGAKSLRTAQLREFRDKLLSLRERLTGQINFLSADNLKRAQHDNEINFRSEEQGTDNFNRDLALSRAGQEQKNVFEIESALNRIRLGTYGICEACGKEIEKGRLEVLPYSRMCVACQSRVEASRKGMRSFEGTSLFPYTDKSLPETPEDQDE